MTGDPIARLLPVGMLGGFRYRGRRVAPLLGVLTTSGTEADWPDTLDLTTGTFTYYGDNRSSGKDLHDSPRGGNVILRRTFDMAHGDAQERSSVRRISCSPRLARAVTWSSAACSRPALRT
jgi:hypothetical protein